MTHSNRKTIRLQEYDYTFPGWYYITICTNERKNLFGRITHGKMIQNKVGTIVKEEWTRTKEIRKNIDLDYYVIMPNHLHGIIIIEQSMDNVGATRRTATTGRGELNSPEEDNTGRIQYAPTNDKFKSPSQTLENVGATQRTATTGRGELNSPEEDNTGRIQYAPTNDKFKSPSQSLGAIIRGFKSSVTKRLRELSGNPELKIWQRNYYEHIIRNDQDLQNIRQYIENNPLKWEIDEYYKA